MANKILKVGDSAAVTIPKQVLREMGVGIGDRVTVTFRPEDNEVVLKAVRPTHSIISDRVARLTAQFIDRYREALRRLA